MGNGTLMALFGAALTPFVFGVNITLSIHPTSAPSAPEPSFS
jgi:hypothetical protein